MESITVKRRISDAAAELARINKINLNTVKGTGAGGRIVREDIDAAIAAKNAPKETPVSESGVAPKGGK